MAEVDLMRRLQKLASTLGARLFRQNTGMAWVGKAVRINRPGLYPVKSGDVVIKNARPFHAGFDGMSDLGGWSPVVITPEMVGETIAVYTQVEVKDGARVTDEQENWIKAVNKAGGRAGIARNEKDLIDILGLEKP